MLSSMQRPPARQRRGEGTRRGERGGGVRAMSFRARQKPRGQSGNEPGGRGKERRRRDHPLFARGRAALPGQFRQPVSVSLAQAQSSHAVSEGSDRAGHRAGIPFLSSVCRLVAHAGCRPLPPGPGCGVLPASFACLTAASVSLPPRDPRTVRRLGRAPERSGNLDGWSPCEAVWTGRCLALPCHRRVARRRPGTRACLLLRAN
jgi:hypothetical protein